MSGSLGDLTVRFTGDASQLTATISEVQGALSGIQSTSAGATNATNTNTRAVNSNAAALRTQSERLQTSGKNLQTLGKSIDTVTKPVQIASAALAAGGVAAANFAIDFENDFADVKKTVEGTPEQLEEVRQGIIDMSTVGVNGNSAIPLTTAQLTELAAAGGQLGIETENIIDFTETMAMLGTATNLSGESGAQTLARFMNVANVSQDQISNLGSAIVDLGNNFATTESEIANMAMDMGETGTTVGISAQDILAYSTALSSMGVDAAAGGSSLQRIWLDMHNAVSTGGEELQSFAEISGKSSAEFKQQWQEDASGAFQAFLKGLNESSDQAGILTELGFSNVRDQRALLALAGEQGFEILTEAIERSNTAWSENTALQTEFENKAETTASQIQIMNQNLVEAGRSIGETFLPTIVSATGSISSFAQGIANMSDEGKETLIGVATGIVAVGAGAKVVSSSVKGIGDFVEALGKIGVEVPSLASMGPVALAVAGGIVAIGTAAYAGKKAYDAWYTSNYNWSEGLSDTDDKLKEQINSLKTLNEYSNQLEQLNLIINSPDSSQEQIDEAKSKIEEIKTLLSEEYNLVIKSDNSNLDDALDTAKQRKKYEVEALATELNADLSEKYDKFLSYEDDYAAEEKLYNSAQERLDIYSALKNKATEINAAWESGAISYNERNQALADIIKEAGVDITDIRTEGVDLSYGIDNEFEIAAKEVENYKNKLDSLNASRDEFVAISKSFANKELELLNINSLEGNAEAAEDNLNKIADTIKRCGDELDKNGYAQAASLAMNGIGSLEEAWNAGGQTLDNVVKDYISASQKFGASAAQTAVGAALIQNGFYDIASAADDGKLELINEQANELAKSMGLLKDNQRLEISVNGDISKITEVDGKIQEIDGEKIDITLNAEGNYDVLNEAGEKVGEIDGETANVQVNAEGNYDVLNEAEEKIAEIDGETGSVSLEVEDGATPTIEQINSVVGELDGRAVSVQLNAEGNFDVLDAAGEKIAEIDGETAIVTVETEVENTETQAPDIQGKANYEMGEHPTEAPSIDGVANYSGNFPTEAPTVYGTAVYHAVVEGAPNAKGTQDFKGGMAIINDEKGVSDPRELVQIGGKGYIFEGRDVVVPLPKHAKVYTAAQTKEMLSAIPHFASGYNNEDWENAKSDRTHARNVTYSIISAREELEWLSKMKEQFASDAEVIKEIEEDVVTYTREMWQEDLDAMEYAYNMGWTTKEEYYQSLVAYRDENFAPDTEEYRDTTLELHQYAVQQIEDANDVSEAYIDLHGSLNDWAEMGTGMGDVWQTVNKRNVQAAQEGLITWEDYFDTRDGFTEQFLDNYISYSEDWIASEKEYHNMSAESNAAAIKRQMNEVEAFFAAIGELTDEEYAVKISIETDLQEALYDVIHNSITEWEDDADFYKTQADVYGWDFLNSDDSELDFLNRKLDNYYSMLDGTYWDGTELEGTELTETEKQYVLRAIDETMLDIYQATEDSYDELLDVAQDRMDEVEQLLNDRLTALQDSWEVEDRAESKAEALSDIEKYQNAVTIEGKEKYQAALDELKEIEREEELYQLELENNAIIEQMQAEYEALEAEKQKILQQTRDANLAIADMLEPFKQDITDSTQLLIDTLNKQIENLKPSVNVTQNITQYISDRTDAILYSNSTINSLQTSLGG